MGLSISLNVVQPVSIYDADITHNLTGMAKEAGIYELLWRGSGVARDMIAPLTEAIGLMESDPERFRAFDAKNDWGTYDDFLPWLRRLLIACLDNPEATIEVSR